MDSLWLIQIFTDRPNIDQTLVISIKGLENPETLEFDHYFFHFCVSAMINSCLLSWALL